MPPTIHSMMSGKTLPVRLEASPCEKPLIWKPRLVKTPMPIMFEMTSAAAGQVETACLEAGVFSESEEGRCRVVRPASISNLTNQEVYDIPVKSGLYGVCGLDVGDGE